MWLNKTMGSQFESLVFGQKTNCSSVVAFSQTTTTEEPIESDDRRGHRASYYKDGEIHVNVLGTSERKPLTTGQSKRCVV